MSSQINSSSDAFILKDKEIFKKGNKNVGDKDSINLNYYLGCPHLMGSESFNFYSGWYGYKKKHKALIYMPKRDIKRMHNNHQQVFKRLPFSGASLFVLLWALSLACLCAGGPLIILINIYSWYQYPLGTFWQEVIDPLAISIILGSFFVSQIAKFGVMHSDDRFGFMFDRPSGKVLHINKDKVTEYDFKDFVPLNDANMLTGGGLSHDTYLYNTKNDLSFVIETTSVTRGVLAWNYLVQFMDVTQPIPDLPIHETTRHLDPVTKAYDEKIGREPNFREKLGKEEASKIHFKKYEKAKQWVVERRALLQKSGTKNKNFLNDLVKQHLV